MLVKHPELPNPLNDSVSIVELLTSSNEDVELTEEEIQEWLTNEEPCSNLTFPII